MPAKKKSRKEKGTSQEKNGREEETALTLDPQKSGDEPFFRQLNFNPGGEFIFSSRFFCRQKILRGQTHGIG